jgi:hypothetical protein
VAQRRFLQRNRRAGEADERRIRQGVPHVLRVDYESRLAKLDINREEIDALNQDVEEVIEDEEDGTGGQGDVCGDEPGYLRGALRRAPQERGMIGCRAGHDDPDRAVLGIPSAAFLARLLEDQRRRCFVALLISLLRAISRPFSVFGDDDHVQ